MENLLKGNLIPPTAQGYTIGQSLRLDSASSSYLSRAFTSSTTWTLNVSVKRANLSAVMGILEGAFQFNSGNTATAVVLTTTELFRDTASFYNINVSNNGLEINGTNIGSVTTSALTDADIGRTGTSYFDGYIAEMRFIDGQSLTASNFGEFDATYGHWKPKAYTGSYGTEGFYLTFSNGANIGEDSSGNGNDFTATNLSATDIVLDSPTNNFAVLNPLSNNYALILAEGNTKSTFTGVNSSTVEASLGMSSGKWYAEFLVLGTAVGAQTYPLVGITLNEMHGNPDFLGGIASEYSYSCNGNKINNNVSISVGTTFAVNDIMMVAFDSDNGKIWWGKNGTWISSGDPANGLNPIFSGIPSDTYMLAACGYNSTTISAANFGQDSSFAGNKTAQGNSDANGIGDFYYAPPAGYLALCTANLPEPTVVPREHFNAVAYTGDGTSSNSITGVGFQPDLTWIKSRANTPANLSHVLNDVVRTPNHSLFSNLTNAESLLAMFTSFDSDGFTVDITGANATNYLNDSLISWSWKAGGTPVTNNDGTITSSVSANVDAGFSIVSYTGNGTSGSTIGHGLNDKPDLIITKRRESTSDWQTYASSLGATKALWLNLTNAAGTHEAYWNNTEPTTAVFTAGSNIVANTSQMISYCFHSVEGYSKIGKYIGNGSADGTFVYCGFRPRYIMIKRTDIADDWRVYDAERDIDNDVLGWLEPNTTDIEAVAAGIDFTANGFKLRSNPNATNASGGTYLFYAVAENPFKYTNAR